MATRDPEKRLFRVRLARPIVQKVDIDVAATDEIAAVEAAIRDARKLPDHAWSGTFDPLGYRYDVHGLIDSEAAIESGTAMEEWTALQEDDVRYCLLRADLSDGYGTLLCQPWMAGIGELMLSDLSGDWVDAIEGLKEGGPTEVDLNLGLGALLQEIRIIDANEQEVADDTGPVETPSPMPPVSINAATADDKVVDLDARRLNRRGMEVFPLVREFSVSITIRRAGDSNIIGFSFDRIELTPETIDDVTHDLRFVADRLIEDRAGLLDQKDD